MIPSADRTILEGSQHVFQSSRDEAKKDSILALKVAQVFTTEIWDQALRFRPFGFFEVVQ